MRHDPPLGSPTHTVIESPIGALTLLAVDGALVGLYMQEHRHRPDPASFGDTDETGLDAAAEQLGAYFEGRRSAFELPVVLHGTPFQRAVWAALDDIPYGSTQTYGQLAARIGRPTASRAVGLAVGRNPVSIVVPCHRVVGSSGKLTGYGGGLERKRRLLDLERKRGLLDLERKRGLLDLERSLSPATDGPRTTSDG